LDEDGKVKLKVNRPRWPRGGVEVYTTVSLTSALDRVGGQRRAPAALPPGKGPGTHCFGGYLGTMAGLNGSVKSRYLIGIRSLDRQARSNSLSVMKNISISDFKLSPCSECCV
jgi:hypothetical protein